MNTTQRINPILKIDPEFESKIPPLTVEEYRQLEENIVTEGVILMPLIIWNGTIVDGHNRYKIAQAHPEIIFTVYEKDFENRYEALAWICKNQLGRRNLTRVQMELLLGERYEAEKMAARFRGNQYTLSSKSGAGQIEPGDARRHRTRQKIALEAGVSEAAIKRYGQFAKGVAAAEEVAPGFRQEILAGKIKPTQQEMRAAARFSPAKRKTFAELIMGTSAADRKSRKADLAVIQKISDDMAQDKPRITAQDAVQQFEWKVTRVLQNFDDTFIDWPQLITDEPYHQQVVATLQDLKQYILHIEAGALYEWDREARKITL